MSFKKIRRTASLKIRQVTGFFSISPLLLFIPFTLLFFSKPSILTDGHPSGFSERSTSRFTLLFIGDVMQHMPQLDAAWNDSLGKYIYDSTFQYVSSIISDYDYSIGNLETTLAGKPYSGYPAFSSPDDLITGLQRAGFDILGTANNHCCDRGKTGIERTISVLDSMGMKHLGTYRIKKNKKTESVYLIDKNGIRIALLNYTFGTNGIPVPDGDIVNLIDKGKMEADLNSAAGLKPDKIILFLHWGDEYQLEPNAFQKDIAEFCFNHGVDIIIGSHPHVIQPMEWHKADSLSKEKLVVWSLGNYVSNQRKRYTDGGAMVGLTLKKENGKTSIESADYQLTWVYNPIKYGKRQYYILPVTQFEDDTLLMDKESNDAFKTFITDSRERLRKNLNIPEKR